MLKEYHRSERVAILIQRQLATILQKQTLDQKIPSLTTFSAVDLSPDLRQAKIYVCVHGRFPRYNYRHMVVGLAFTGSSLLLFNLQNQVPELYWLIHSMWHALGLCGAWYWASVMPLYPAWLNIGQDASSLANMVASPIDMAQLWEDSIQRKPQDLEPQPTSEKTQVAVRRRIVPKNTVQYSSDKRGHNASRKRQ